MFADIWYFKYYVRTGGIVGVLLPLAYIFWGIAQGLDDLKALQAALTHTFLLLCQIFAEIAFGRSNGFSLPARASIPIFYNTWRLFTLYSWVKTDLFQKGEASIASGLAREWVLFGSYLAIANWAFWSFNLFCFLLPIYLPRVFRQYFEAEAALSKTKHT
ncbi:hypothetical protein O6H91_02G141900 [Diphasiastrum complanatum]|nr:hypothetical protein O6H91_02G141900 [Diphasiastrum complanatum]